MASGADSGASFERRAGTVLIQASELATLCATPACVVIYNPNDVSRPWRMWPESAAEVRSVVELYKARAGSQRVGENAVSGGDGGLREMTEEEAVGLLSGVDGRIREVQAMIDLTIRQHEKNNAIAPPPVAAPPPLEERAMVVAGGTEWMTLHGNVFADRQEEEEEAFDITEFLDVSALESVDVVDDGGGDDLGPALIDDSGHCCFEDDSGDVADEAQQYVDKFGAKASDSNHSNGW